jgi:hypothetical protein
VPCLQCEPGCVGAGDRLCVVPSCAWPDRYERLPDLAPPDAHQAALWRDGAQRRGDVRVTGRAKWVPRTRLVPSYIPGAVSLSDVDPGPHRVRGGVAADPLPRVPLRGPGRYS